MNMSKSCLWTSLLVAGVVLVVGCQSPQHTSDVQQIPQITKLVAKATAAPPVHRFRKPVRDERARTLRLLSAECDRMIAELRGPGVTAEALTGSTSDATATATGEVSVLEMSLAQLGMAARRGDIHAIRSHHATALTAYTRGQSGPAQPNP